MPPTATDKQAAHSSPSVPQPSTTRFARSDAVVFTELEDVVVMLDTDEGMYYELDTIGSRIWNLLEPEPSVGGLINALTNEYDVDKDTCRDDVLAFLDELTGLGLTRRIRQDSGDIPDDQ